MLNKNMEYGIVIDPFNQIVQKEIITKKMNTLEILLQNAKNLVQKS